MRVHRNRRRPAARPTRGVQRNKRGDGGFHHWKLGNHDVHISDGIPFALHESLLDIVVEPHLARRFPHVVTDKGFIQSDVDVKPVGHLRVSTDPKHGETWVWRI